MLAAFRRAYGAAWWHAVLVLGCLALTALVVGRVWPEPLSGLVLLWFGACVLVHDLVLLPAVSSLDRFLTSLPRPRVRVVNHLRVPLLASGLLLLMFLPGIAQQGTETHLAATGMDQGPYFARWLWLSAAFAVLSALCYVLRVLVHLVGRRTAGPGR
ncbi:hypothetical protein IQ251_05250 [Saccharopolyspora sp. HNM0983]|uniref:Lipoprotein n=1 Tax=Saccharopolyspora montiporae TaxID=2781240 RepID=A0A929FZK9_9PSEU|nr:hypothetical protein [Saccharopolyspora sp. HNM0983]MBE9373852.1 hypothetical protein [Saccharopolyspora sp. HNM0983]